jgi:predicted metal-dependent phosphoesterase TrpH
MRIDLHTHSLYSDGTDTPSALVDRARQVGLDVVALTDHDTFAGVDEAVSRGEQTGVRVVSGMELSCSRVGQSVHLLAYGADPASPGLATEMVKVRGGRMGRLAGVLDRLAQLGVPVTEEQVLDEVGQSPSVGRPHIADAMVKAGHVANRTEAFERFLADGGPAHVPRYAIAVERGIDLVHQAGGVAVIAHPWGRGRDQILPPEVLRRLTFEQGLDGIEVNHQDHDSATRRRLGTVAGELGLLATGSSDYHGTGKLDHELGCNTTDPEVFDTLMDRLDARRVS